MTITICIPVYNVSAYIERCTRSLFEQTYKDIEYIFVDDCSPDDSVDKLEGVIKEYKDRANSVRIIHHDENKGLGAARNTGIDNAKGNYIFFLDGDDWISPQCIQLLVEKAIATNSDFVVGSVNRIEEETHKQIYTNIYPNSFITRKGAGVYAVNHWPNFHIEVWNKLYKISFLNENRIRFVHRIFEDYYFDFRLRACANRIAFIPEVTLFYSIRPNSILTTLKATKGTDESLETFCEIIRYLQKMLVEEFSTIEGIYDLYFERIVWIFENFERYKYSKKQWDQINGHTNGFCSFVKNEDVLSNARNRYIYRKVIKKECASTLYKARDAYDKLQKRRARRKQIKEKIRLKLPLLGKMFSIVKRLIKWCFFGGKQIVDWKRKLLNELHFRFHSGNHGWKKYCKHPVYGNEETGSVFDPCVIEENGRLVMFVSERKTNGIDRLESTDGIHWEKIATALLCQPNTWEHWVNRASVLQHDGVWHMWYTGQSPHVAAIGHAVSPDGRTFTRVGSKCLIAELPLEGVSVMNPCVLWNSEKKLYQMWYAAGENYEPDVLFYAESKDGDVWIKKEEPVLTKLSSHKWEKVKVGGCDVKMMNDGTYKMYYIGYQTVDRANICFATSTDGILWKRPECNLILCPSANSWDADSVYKPSYLKKYDKEYLWYNGRKDNKEFVGLAIRNCKKI